MDTRKLSEKLKVTTNVTECESMQYLESAANIDEKDVLGNTALHYAAERGDVTIVRMLCRDGINVNITNNDGDTALHYMIKSGNSNLECAQLLLDSDIERLIKNKDGYTAEQLVKIKIKDIELCTKMYAVFYNVTLQSKPLSKLKTIPSVRYANLNRRYKGIGLKNPDHYTGNPLNDVLLEACKSRASTNRLSVIDAIECNLSNGLITISDIKSSNLKKIRKYLQHKGNPNLSIKPDHQSLIVHAIDNMNLYLVLELLRYGADLNFNDVKDNEKNKDMLLAVMKELSSDVRLVKAMVDHNVERESHKLHDLILTVLLAEKDDQEIFEFDKLGIAPRGSRDDKCKKLIMNICNIPIMSEVKYNQSSYTCALGLLSLYSPIEILYSLLELLPEFTVCQKLGSVVLMKYVFLHAWKFKHELPSYNHLQSYCQHLGNNGITRRLNNIYIYMYEFSQSPMLKGYFSLINITSRYPNSSTNIIEKIIEAALSDKNADLNKISDYIANELVALTAKYYHQCEMINNSQQDKIDFFCLEHEHYLFTALKAFIEKIILNQGDINKSEKAIKLFIKIAQKCLTNNIMPDLNSVAVILDALNSKWITRLGISLDKKTSARYSYLRDIILKSDNFKMHREFQKVYKYCLPWFEVIKKNLDTIANPYQLSGAQCLGDAYEPLMKLKDSLDLYVLQCDSNLNVVLKSDISEEELKKLSVSLREPEIPKLTPKCSVDMFNRALRDQRLTHSPLMIKCNHTIYPGDAALLPIKKWLNEMKDKSLITGDDVVKIYASCQSYVTQYHSMLENKSYKRSADLSSSESHKFFSTNLRNSNSSASRKHSVKVKMSSMPQTNYSKRSDS